MGDTLPILSNNILIVLPKKLPVNKYMQNIDTKEAYLNKGNEMRQTS